MCISLFNLSYKDFIHAMTLYMKINSCLDILRKESSAGEHHNLELYLCLLIEMYDIKNKSSISCSLCDSLSRQDLLQLDDCGSS